MKIIFVFVCIKKPDSPDPLNDERLPGVYQQTNINNRFYVLEAGAPKNRIYQANPDRY